LCELYFGQQIKQDLFQKQLEIVKLFEKHADALSQKLRGCEVVLP